MRSSSSSKQNKLEGSVVFKNFQVGKKIGVGAFGEIYRAHNQTDQNECYAIKAQSITTRHPQLLFEAKLYKYLNNDGEIIGIPKVYAAGVENGYNLMMMDLLGKSLEDIFVAKGKSLSLKSVLAVGYQMIERIEYLHSRGFLHRDIKPDNMLVGPKGKEHLVYLIDMGLSKKYLTKDKTHIPYRQGKELTGTARYASVATHRGFQQGRRDDIESIGYVLMYFLRGILPWQNMKANTAKVKYEMIMHKKVSTPLEQLCKGFPSQLAKFIQHARSLSFQQKPDYVYLKELLEKAAAQKGIEFNKKFDEKQ